MLLFRARSAGRGASLTWVLLAALVLAPGLPERVHAAAPSLGDASPRGRKVRLRVGERQRFAAPAVGGETGCTWGLDNQTVPGMALTWDFVPTPAHRGVHRVTLRLDGPAGVAERTWVVRVDPPRPPRVEGTSPAAPLLEVAPDEAVELVLRTRPSADGETVRTSWTVDGVAAGEGERLELRPSRPGRVRVRALAIGSLGSATVREWAVEVRPTVLAAVTPTTAPAPPTTLPSPPTTLPSPPTTLPSPPTAPAPTTTTVPALPATTLPAYPTSTLPLRAPTTPPAEPRSRPTTRVAPPRAAATTLPTDVRAAPLTTPAPEPVIQPRTPPADVARVPSASAPSPPGSGGEISTSEIEFLLQRFAQAWRRHDVEELRRIGHVTSEAQAAALRDYFAKAGDLDVEVELREVRSRGSRRTVRFTRRDRFRDPLGHLITQETPLEKDVARTADGVRFVPPGS